MNRPDNTSIRPVELTNDAVSEENPNPPHAWLRFRLSLLMFLQFSTIGAFLPIFTIRLKELGFTPWEIGYVASTQPLAAVISSLLVGQLADRWFAAERCLAVCAGLAACVVSAMPGIENPLPFFLAAFGFWMAVYPGLNMGLAVSFRQLHKSQSQFGPIRSWGTVGWVVAGWFMGFWLSETGMQVQSWIWRQPLLHMDLTDAFRLSTVLATLQALYGLTLPHTPPNRDSLSKFAPLAALSMLRDKNTLVFWICSFGLCMTFPFGTQIIPLFLEHQSFTRSQISFILTICQSTEFLTLAFLPRILDQFGIRRTLWIGMIAWVVDMGIFSFGRPFGLVMSALPLHGVCVGMFVVGGQVFVNRKSREDYRASAQALLAFTVGTGTFLGSLAVGWLRRSITESYSATFFVACTIALCMSGLFLLRFQVDEF